MLDKQIVMVWAALSSAVFPIVTIAGEWEAYQDLKAAMVRSTAKHDRPIPKWLVAPDFKPRPWLDLSPVQALSRFDVVSPDESSSAQVVKGPNKLCSGGVC